MDTRRIIYYDGICKLCDAWVRFVIRYDRVGQFYFSALDSPFARQRLTGLLPEAPDRRTVIYQRDGILLRRSTAALYILKDLGGIWKWFFYLGILLPRAVRDAVYQLVARNRYRLMGRVTSCPNVPPEIKDRWLAAAD